MNAKLYPSGVEAADVDERETTPTTSDYLEVLSGDESKYITIANLFANAGPIGATTLSASSGVSFTSTTTYTASGAIADTDTLAVLASSTPATVMAMTIAAPAAGRLLVITQDDAGTAGHTVTLSAGNYNGGAGTIATFNARNETLMLLGLSSTRFVIVGNVGSISIS